MTSSEVRDAVHGLIELTADEWKIVNSPAFQRLRGVQQLAATHLIYPGARHSRFEHCMGACHVAGRIATSLGMSPDDRKRVRLAALVHDLGHGPFSHVSEFVFEELTGKDHVHEQISAAIVQHHKPVRDVLGATTAKWIAELLSGTGHGAKRSVARDIVAGPPDIDKLDYLLRDSLYCGVEYGRYDLDKIIEAARIVPTSQGDYLAYHSDGVFAVEGMLLARYHMTRQVYGHKTRLATDQMLMRAMKFGVEEGILPQKVFAPGDLDDSFVAEYLKWDDNKTTRMLCDKPDTKAGQMMQSLVHRRLFKRTVRIVHEDLRDHKDFGPLLAGEAIQPKPGLLGAHQAEIEKLVAEAAGVDPMWVTLLWEELQNPIISSNDFRVTDKEVLFTNGNGSIERFSELSEIFSADAGQRTRRAVSVYIRPPDGTAKFSSTTLNKIAKAAHEGLLALARAGQEV
jgi:HD superfamily phosphohydrolase